MSTLLRRPRFRVASTFAAPLVALASLAGGPAAAQADGAPTTTTFSYTGGSQSFTVPAGVSRVTISAIGGHGGAERFSNPGAAGAGGTASGTFAVTRGDVLSVLVAGDGAVNGGYGFGRGGDGGYRGGGPGRRRRRRWLGRT